MKNFMDADLEPIKFKLMNKTSGVGWSLDLCDEVELQYKRWMVCSKEHPEQSFVPSYYIDIFWHYHILDTKKYAQDCQEFFGHFVHHFPYFGMLNTEDEIKASAVWERTKELFLKRYGVEIDALERREANRNDKATDCTPCKSMCDGQDCNEPSQGCKIDEIQFNEIRPRPVRANNLNATH